MPQVIDTPIYHQPTMDDIYAPSVRSDYPLSNLLVDSKLNTGQWVSGDVNSYLDITIPAIGNNESIQSFVFDSYRHSVWGLTFILKIAVVNNDDSTTELPSMTISNGRHTLDLSTARLEGAKALRFTRGSTDYLTMGYITGFEIIGVPEPMSFKLYRRGTDGTPTLFMPDQTTIGSSLSTADLSTDLASIASKEYVANTIDNLSRSSLSGKVDSYGDLPVWNVDIPYTSPVLTRNGIPHVDDYAVDSSPIWPGYPAWYATSAVNNMQFHTIQNGTTRPYFGMYFKNPVKVTRITLTNRILVPTYAIADYTVYGSNDGSNWVELTSGVNSILGSNQIWYIDLSSNTEFYNSYRIQSTIPAGSYICQFGIIPSGFISDSDSSKFGAIYLVGTEGNLEEYIFTSDGWERMGEIRQSDVDLSGYTTTEGMNTHITTGNGIIDTNIETMRTDIQSYLDTLEQEISGSMGELPLDGRFQNDVPTVWDSKLSNRAMLFVTEPDVVPYAAPELRDSNGTPFVDEYAVSVSSTYSGIHKARKATYDDTDSEGIWHSSNVGLPQYLYMTFKTPLQATSIYIRNRNIASYNVYAVKDFVIEGKDGSTWAEVYRGTNPSSASYGEYEVTFENEEFYNEYRLTVLSSYGGAGGNNYVTINVARLSGNIKKS